MRKCNFLAMNAKFVNLSNNAYMIKTIDIRTCLTIFWMIKNFKIQASFQNSNFSHLVESLMLNTNSIYTYKLNLQRQIKTTCHWV